MAIKTSVLVWQVVVLFLFFAVTLFLPAGTVAWPAGWCFLLLFFGFVVAITLWLFKHNRALLRERMTGSAKPDQETWDRVIMLVALVLFTAWLVVMALDAARFHWSQMSLWLHMIGGILLLCSFYLLYLTFRENPHLSPAVRIQDDRGQVVVSTGPYRYVRHPMYSAFVAFVPGTALLLGSWYGVVVGLTLVGMVAGRAVLEERTLRKGLKGYDVYMAQVKYRLIPHVW